MTALHNIARLPSPEDNVAIAIQTLPPGTAISHEGSSFALSCGILEGHRFAVKTIQAGEHLTSWGQPFGTATKPVQAGEYVCNANMLDALSHRALDFSLPSQPNFSDDVPPFVFDVDGFTPAQPLTLYPETRSFLGYPRPGSRGTGTRNFIVLLGTTALTAGFVRMLEAHLKSHSYPHIDGIVALAHTEGGHRSPNNRDLLMRTLAGWMVHPNVGAVLAVDYASGVITNAVLEDFMRANSYPLDDVPHHFMSVTESIEASRDAAAGIVTGWLETVSAARRESRPLKELKIALQCGGSDAFSGISGNPLAAWVAKEVIRCGGSANLAETDELISAESYILDKLPDVETGQHFLAQLRRFQERTGWHGHAITGNPSGGNLYRGLYNIYLKSLGAAAKKHPDVRLDWVIEYAEPMRAPGFYFMDSPGNDLESITGQVASGCNMIFFVTGNGSITNFPFVPTIKIVTTTRRHQLLSKEMDVNAGAYLDGTAMDEIGAQTLELCINVASGQQTAGEKAGHAQVQIWRDWRQTQAVNPVDIRPPRRAGLPLPLGDAFSLPDVQMPFYRTPRGPASDQIGLILPTSLCAGQIARLTAEQLNIPGVSRFVALAHTEGCGSPTAPEYIDTLMGYMQHPLVAHCLLMEHGCEITHNGYLKNRMRDADLDPAQFGWASIQLDGGIEAVQGSVRRWFSDQINRAPAVETAGFSAARIGLVTQGEIAEESASALCNLASGIVALGGTVILPEGDSLVEKLPISGDVHPTLNYAHRPHQNGLHIMERASEQWSETLTGLGACGVEALLIYTDTAPLQGHPFIPSLYLTASARYEHDVDLLLAGDAASQRTQILEYLVAVLSREYVPRVNVLGNVDFQITRGPLGVSL